MSRKTLIAILCITIIAIITGATVVYSQNDSYTYKVVNSTKDEINENTTEKEYIGNQTYIRDYETSSRGGNILRQINTQTKYIDVSAKVNSKEISALLNNISTANLLNEAKCNIDKYSDNINAVANVTNGYRNEVYLNNLTLDKNLSIAASVRALEMAYTNKLSHTRPDGAICFIVLKDLEIKYNYAGENIGDGFTQSEDVCNAWKESPSHYKNIINRKYNKIGIGVAQSLDGRMYWVQIFSN